MNDVKNEKESFFKNHADAIAVVGVNIAIAAILISMWIAQSARIDTLYNILINMMDK